MGSDDIILPHNNGLLPLTNLHHQQFSYTVKMLKQRSFSFCQRAVSKRFDTII